MMSSRLVAFPPYHRHCLLGLYSRRLRAQIPNPGPLIAHESVSANFSDICNKTFLKSSLKWRVRRLKYYDILLIDFPKKRHGCGSVG
jgi:hypothetical protein